MYFPLPSWLTLATQPIHTCRVFTAEKARSNAAGKQKKFVFDKSWVHLDVIPSPCNSWNIDSYYFAFGSVINPSLLNPPACAADMSAPSFHRVWCVLLEEMTQAADFFTQPR